MFSIFPLNNDISNPERQVKRVLKESMSHQSMLAHSIKKKKPQPTKVGKLKSDSFQSRHCRHGDSGPLVRAVLEHSGKFFL